MILNIFSSGSAILNYHRVCEDKYFPKNNDALVVSVSKFKEQLTFLKKNFNLVSLEKILRFESGKKSNICITFDDGYKDNLTHALPILTELNIPATIYIVTKFYENDFSIWWTELHDFIWQKSKNISFIYNEKKFDFNINTHSEKNKCLNDLSLIIKKLNKNEQYKFLEAVTENKARKQYKSEFLSKEDLNILNINPLITLGAHTHNHLSLKNLTKDECVKEIELSKKKLENILNCKVNHFSYPYGTKNDAGQREFEIVKDLGFHSAVTTSVGKLTKKRLFNLPRIHVNQNSSKKILKFKLSIFYYLYIKIKELLV